MKYKDPKTGEVFEYTRDAINAYCGKECDDCPISIENNQKHLFCFEYVSKFPTEAARLMGYEVIEDSSTEIDETPTDSTTTLDDTQTVSGDRPTEEDNNMDRQDKPLSEWTLGEAVEFCHREGSFCTQGKLECPFFRTVCHERVADWGLQKGVRPRSVEPEAPKANTADKPRLAEVLGVEVGERFRVGDVGCDFWIEADGWPRSELFDRNASAKWVVNAINHPESIIRLPLLTEPEIAIMRAMGAKWVSRDKNGTCANLWESEPHLTADGYAKAKMIANVFRGRFPSVKPGDCFCAEGDW